MLDEGVHRGQQVRLVGEHRRGVVAELDHQFHAARVIVNGDGGERWVLLDQLEAVPVWDPSMGLSGGAES